MKTINLTLFSFDELSENVQKKITDLNLEFQNIRHLRMEIY